MNFLIHNPLVSYLVAWDKNVMKVPFPANPHLPLFTVQKEPAEGWVKQVT